jgi:hypothetical protein
MCCLFSRNQICTHFFRVYIGYDETTNTVLRDTKPADYEAQANEWQVHADTILPRAYMSLAARGFASSHITLGKPCIKVYQISVDSDGIPIVPRTDVAEASPAQLAILLKEYFEVVWGKFCIISVY